MHIISVVLGVALCYFQAQGSFQRLENDLALENNQNHRHRYRRANNILGYSVSFENDMTDSMKEDFNSQFQEFVVREFEGLNFVHLHVPEVISEDVILDLKQKTYVKVIDHETAYKSYALYWNKDRIGVHEQKDIRAGNGDYEGNGWGVHIYVVDSGIDDHIEFGNRIDRNASRVFEERKDSYDCNGHGTRVAGIAAGRYTGVATQAILVSYAIMDCNHKQTGALVIEDALAKIREDKQNFPNRKIVINLSLGPASHMNSSYALQSLEEDLTDMGVIIIRAAGNSNDNACLYGQNSLYHSLSVGSTNIRDEMSANSNYGSCVDILAPGENVPFPLYSELTHSSRDYGSGSGTSFAAPLVSGVAAVLMQRTFSDGKRVIPYILGNATVGAIKKIVVKDPSNTTPNKLLYLKKVPEFVGKKKWTLTRMQGWLECVPTVGIPSRFYPSGDNGAEKLENCKRTALANQATGFNMDLAQTWCDIKTCKDDIRDYMTSSSTFDVFELDAFMVPKYWSTFKSNVKGGLSCPEESLFDPRAWPHGADIDTYQKKVQRCKEESTYLEASGFNFDNATNKCSIRKCSGDRTYDTSSPLVDVFEFAETKQGRFRYAKNLMQGLDLKCLRVDGQNAYTISGRENWIPMKDVNSLEGCAGLASTNGVNSFTFELTSGDCYGLLCDSVYQEYSDDDWSSPPGNFILFTDEDSVPQHKDGFSVDDGFGNHDTVLFCNNVNSSSYVIQNAKSITACIDIAMFTNADALNYDTNSTICQLMSCPDEYTVINAPVPGNWFYYRHFTIKKDRITTNGFRFVPLERSRVLGSTCTNLTAETGVYSDDTESCSQMVAQVNANAFQYSQNKECVAYSCAQSVGSTSYKTYTEDRLTDDYANYYLTYAAPLLIPEIYKGYGLKTFTGAYTSTNYKLVCDSFHNILDVTLEECSFFTSVSNGNAFNYRRTGDGKCEPKLCYEIETESVAEADWLMYVDEERINPSSLVLITLASGASAATFNSRYPNEIVEISENVVDENILKQILLNISSVAMIEELQGDVLVQSIERYQEDDREVVEVYTKDSSPAQNPIINLEVNKLTGRSSYKSGSKGYDHEIEVKNPMQVKAQNQMNAFTRGSFTNILDTYSVSGGFGQIGATSYDIRTGGATKPKYSPYNGVHAMGGGMVGYGDVYTESGVTDKNGGYGLTDMNGGWGITDLNAAFGMTDLNGGWGITDLNAGWGITDINGAWGVTDLNGGFGITDLNAGFGQTDLNGGWGMTDLNGGWGATDLNAGWGITDLNGGWGLTDLNGGFGQTDLNGGWGVSLLHGDYGYPGLNGDYSYKDVIGSAGITDINGIWGDSGSGYGVQDITTNDIYANDNELDVVALADMFKRHSIGEIDITNWIFDENQAPPIIQYKPVTTSSFPMLVKSHSKTFKFVPNLERNQHLYCTGEQDIIFDVISVQDCAILTNSSEYNGFTYSVASKICRLETCDNGVYSTIRSAIGFVTYVRLGIYPSKSKDFTFLPFNSFGRLGCKETIDESTIFENMASIETCLATAAGFTDPAVNFKTTTGQCELLTCKDDLHIWIVTNERDLLVYTRTERVHPSDISFRSYKTTSVLGGLPYSYQNVVYEDSFLSFPLSSTTYSDDMGKISFDLHSEVDDTFDIEIECKKVNQDSSVIVQTGARVEDLVPEVNTYYAGYTSQTGPTKFGSLEHAHQQCLLDHECVAITQAAGYVNVAVGKSIYSSSNTGGHGYVGRNFIDGDINTYMHGQTSGVSSLTVDLGAVYTIGYIVLWNRQNCCQDRTVGFQIRVWKEGESKTTYDYYDYPEFTATSLKFTIDTDDIQAQYVEFWINVPHVMNVGELEVFGNTNLALGKSVTFKNINPSYPATRLVDGIFSNFAHGERPGETSITIDLGAVYGISYVNLWNRANCCRDRSVGFKIRMWEHEHSVTTYDYYDYPDFNESTEKFHIKTFTRAQFVEFWIDASVVMNVAELEVFGAAGFVEQSYTLRAGHSGLSPSGETSYLMPRKILDRQDGLMINGLVNNERYSNSDLAYNECKNDNSCTGFTYEPENGFLLDSQSPSVECARPSGWCTTGEQYTEEDCDGDGIPDPTCRETSGTFKAGSLLSSQNCISTWGQDATCSSAEGDILALNTVCSDYPEYRDLNTIECQRTRSRPNPITINGGWWSSTTSKPPGCYLYKGRKVENNPQLASTVRWSSTRPICKKKEGDVTSIISDTQRQQLVDDIASKLDAGFVINRVGYGAESSCLSHDITYNFKRIVRDNELLDIQKLYNEEDGEPCSGSAKSVYITYESGCVQESEISYHNYFYGDVFYSFDSVWECARECSLNSGCWFYTYISADNNCTFRFHDKGRRYESGFISGRSCELYDHDVHYDGSDISIISNIESAYICNAECNVNYECNYWTYDAPSANCHLKKDKSSKSVTFGSVSGKSYGYYSLRSGSLSSSPDHTSWLLTDIEPNSVILQPSSYDGKFHWEKVPGSFTHETGRNKLEIVSNTGDLLMKNVRLTGNTFIVNSVLSKFKSNTARDAKLVGGDIELVDDSYFTVQSSTGYASDLSAYSLPSVGKATFIVWGFTDSLVSVDILCRKTTSASSMYVYLGPNLNNYNDDRTEFSPESNKACIAEQNTLYGDDLLNEAGDSMSVTNIDTVDICSQSCFSESGCFYYTYDGNSKTCHYKASRDGKSTSSGLESGKACDGFQWYSLNKKFDIDTGMNVLHFAQKDSGLEIKEVKIRHGDAVFYQTPDIQIMSDGPSKKRKHSITGKVLNDFEVINNYFVTTREQIPYSFYNGTKTTSGNAVEINQGFDYMVAHPGHCQTWCNGFTNCDGFDYIQAGEPLSGGPGQDPSTGCCYFKSGISGIVDHSGGASYIKEVLRNGNVALGKPTSSSGNSGMEYAHQAVDGSLSTKYVSSAENDAFLTVDLEKSFHLTSISVSNQGDELEEFNIQLLDESMNQVYAFAQGGGLTNVALGKSILSFENTYTSGSIAENLVDGNIDTYAHGVGAGVSSIIIDLGTVHEISFVNLWNRQNCCQDRTVGFQIRMWEHEAVKSTYDYYDYPEFTATALKYHIQTPGMRAQFVEFWVDASVVMNVAELEVFGVPGLTNVALGKSLATSQNISPGTPTTNFVDGVVDNYVHGDASGETSITIDLGAVYEINYMILYNRNDCCQDRTVGFEIRMWKDENEKHVFDYQNYPDFTSSMLRYHIETHGIKVQFVEFYVNAAVVMNVAELEVFGFLDLPGYTKYSTGGCIGRNELGTFTDETIDSCRLKCDLSTECTSFQCDKSGQGYCGLSTSCDFPLSVQDESDPNFLFVKQGQCHRPSDWCTGTNQIYSLEDCDNDGIPDPTCRENSASYTTGSLLSSQNCESTWGELGATCSSAEADILELNTLCGDYPEYRDLSTEECKLTRSRPNPISVHDGWMSSTATKPPGCYLYTGGRVENNPYLSSETRWSHTRPICKKKFQGQCSRPSNWCTGTDEVYSLEDCDDDGIPDPSCRQRSGSYTYGSLLSSQACEDTWGLPGATCSSAEGELMELNGLCSDYPAYRDLSEEECRLTRSRPNPVAIEEQWSSGTHVTPGCFLYMGRKIEYNSNLASTTRGGHIRPICKAGPCTRPNGWCNDTAIELYTLEDVDNDGIPDPTCRHTTGSYPYGSLLSTQQCASSWDQGATSSSAEGDILQLNTLCSDFPDYRDLTTEECKLLVSRPNPVSTNYAWWSPRTSKPPGCYLYKGLKVENNPNLASTTRWNTARPVCKKISSQDFAKVLPAPVEARYIRVNRPIGSLHISKLEAYALQENIALRKPTAGAAHYGFSERYISDGQRSSRFYSAATTDSWVELDLVEEKSLRGLLLYTHDNWHNERLANFVVTFLNEARQDVGGTFTNVDHPELSDYIYKIFDQPLESVRYVRLHRDPQTDHLQLFEMEVFEAVNIALGKRATSSALSYDSTTPDQAIDGNIDTRFFATRSAYPFIKLDLGKEFYIDSIEMLNSNSFTERLDEFLVEVMDSNGTITTTYRHSDFRYVTKASYNIRFHIPVLGQFIRVSRPSNEDLQIYELKVFGSERKGKCSVMQDIEIVGTPTRNNDGTDRMVINVESTETCSRLCLWDLECTHYSYFEDDNDCHFLTDVTKINKKTSVVSGSACEFEQDIGIVDYEIWALVPGLIAVDLEVASNFTASTNKPSVNLYVIDVNGKIHDQGTIQPQENNGHWTWFKSNQNFRVSTGANIIRVVQKDAGLLIRGIRISSGEAFFISEKTSIKVAGGTPDDMKFLSGDADQLGLDDSSTAKWKFVPIGSTYKIMLDELYLSATSSSDIVGLEETYSGSALQRWTIEKVSGSTDRYRIGVAADRSGDKNYLAVDADGNNAQLVTFEISSSREKWIIDPGALQQDPSAVIPVIKYHSTVQIKGDQFSSKFGALVDIDWSSSREFHFTSAAAGNVPFADLYIRPAAGITKTSEECLRWGEQIVLAYTADSGYTGLGWYGSRVAQYKSNGRLAFLHGGESPHTFRLQPVVGFNSASTRCVRRGDAAYLVADLDNPDSTVEDSDNGPWGNKVARVSDENFLEFVDGSEAETMFFR